MKQLLFVFVGGGFGSVLRYLINKWLGTTETGFPIGTLTVNILGSLFMGIILGYVAKSNVFTPNQTLLLATGFCGGFTTFSTFAYENQGFLKTGDFTNFVLYTIASFVLGFLAVFAGIFLSKSF
ncbi:fluoride efflux transporter CrcB [Polaribacter tangerinus]|uniref:fluoride efflux transporter CrcB n=1 Tax=Polaribacter tangerinus TaxID=1920034 RepID=UPI000B4C19D9|nr:fluoride efflux transporter CrcB [Polaribacter tangerinus]